MFLICQLISAGKPRLSSFVHNSSCILREDTHVHHLHSVKFSFIIITTAEEVFARLNLRRAKTFKAEFIRPERSFCTQTHPNHDHNQVDASISHNHSQGGASIHHDCDEGGASVHHDQDEGGALQVMSKIRDYYYKN